MVENHLHRQTKPEVCFLGGVAAGSGWLKALHIARIRFSVLETALTRS